MEVEVIRPMWFEGKQTGPGADGEANPVIDLPNADAVYLETIGRVRRVQKSDADVPKENPAAKTRAKTK